MADQMVLGDLLFRLGFDSEQDFLKALDTMLDEAQNRAKSGGGVGGEKFEEEFRKRARQNASGFGNDFVQSLGIQTLGTFLGQTLSNAFQSGISATKQFIGESNQEFKSYQINLNTIATNTNESLDKIKAGIKGISDESRAFSEVEVARGVAELIKAGYDAATALNIVSKSSNLAKSEIDDLTGKYADLGNISKQTSDVMAGFGIAAGDVGRVVDVLAKGAAESKLDITDLVESIAPIGGFAKTAGLSLEEVVSAIAALKNTGLPAAEAATAVRTVLQQLITPPQTVRKAFDELGISLVDSQGKMRPFPEILANIDRVASAGGKGLELLSSGLGTYGVNAAIALGKAKDGVVQFSAELKNSEGYAQQYADALNKGVIEAADFDRQIANAKRSIGEQLRPVLLDLYTNILPPFIKLLQDAAPALERLAKAIDGIGKPNWKPGAKDALDALYTDANRADEALTRISDNQKKLGDAQDKLNKLQLLPKSFGLGLTPFTDDQIKTAKADVAKIEAAIAEDQKRLEDLKRKPTPTPASTPPPAPATPTSTADPSSFKIGGGRGRDKDPVIEQAQELDKALRLLELRYADGKVPLAQYQGELSKLEGQFTALGNSAKTTDQQLSVQQGLSAIRQAREKLNQQADPLQTLKSQYDTGAVSVEDYRKGLVRLLGDYETQIAQVKTGSPEWQKLASGIRSAGEEIGKLDKAITDLRAKDVSPQALFRQGERVLPSDTEQRAATAGSEAGIAFRNAIDRVLEGRFSTTDTDIETLFDTITTAALNNVPRAKEALNKLEDAFAQSGEIAGTGFVKNFDKNLSFSDDQTKAEELARSIGAMFDLTTREGLEAGLNALTKADLKNTYFFKNLEANLQDLLGVDALNRMAFEGKVGEQKVLQDAANRGGSSASTINRPDKFGETGAAEETDGQIKLNEGIADTVTQFDKLEQAYKQNSISAAEFVQQGGEITNTLYTIADQASKDGDIELFNSASKAADGLSGKLNDVLKLTGKLGDALDQDFRKTTKGPETLDQAYLGLFTRVQSLQTLIQNGPEDPLKLEEFLSFVDDELFGALDELDTLIAGLAPDDPELAKLQVLRDLLLSIAQARAGITSVTVLADGTVIPQVQAGNADLGGDAGGAGKKAGTDAPSTLTSQPAPDLSGAAKGLGDELTTIASNFIKDLTDGTPDVGGALRRALGSAADFFLQQMLTGIIGPIAQELGKAAAGALFSGGAGGAAALGPLGLIIGGGLLLGSLLFGGGGQTSSQQASSASGDSRVGGASSITYESILNFNVPFVGSLADPNFRAQLRDYVFSILEEFERRKRPDEAGGTT